MMLADRARRKKARFVAPALERGPGECQNQKMKRDSAGRFYP